jgi:adenylate cyclase
MDPERILQITQWIAASALAGADEAELLDGMCSRIVEAGIPISRALVGLDTLHPVLAGGTATWRRNRDAVETSTYLRDNPGVINDSWLRSPFYYLQESGEAMARWRLTGVTADNAKYPVLADRAQEGDTDYVALLARFSGRSVIGEMDGVYASFSTDRPSGFTDEELETFDRLLRALAVALNGVALGRIAATLVRTYLGRDAGQRVLSGSIERGKATPLSAVIWFSDLRGYTRLTDKLPPELIVTLLNDYADALVTAVTAQGGEVLKFIGDGLLAMFKIKKPDRAARACAKALAAVSDGFARIAAVNQRRAADGLAITMPYVALHVGEVFYGNIGAVDRLDFTVVGPAVNETSRMLGMSRSLEQDVIVSAAFAEAAGANRNQLVSLGRYALRGVRRPQELFTLEPATL